MSAVKEAVKLAAPAEGDFATIEREAVELSARAKRLLPVEQHAKTAISNRMAELRLQTERLKIARDTGCPMIPLDILGWTAEFHVKIAGKLFGADLLRPQLAIVPVEDGQAGMQIRANDGWWEIRPNSIPKPITEQYASVGQRLIRAAKASDHRIEMTYRYKGVIPDSTRDKIDEHRNHFDRMYLVCDAPESEWSIDTERNPRPPRLQYLDPIVVGYAAETLWMIDVFDPTPIEEYIAMEWALKPADEQRAIERG